MKTLEITCIIYKVKSFKFLVSLLVNQNWVLWINKMWLWAGNACYYSVQTLLSSRVISENLRIEIDKGMILPDVLFGSVT